MSNSQEPIPSLLKPAVSEQGALFTWLTVRVVWLGEPLHASHVLLLGAPFRGSF